MTIITLEVYFKLYSTFCSGFCFSDIENVPASLHIMHPHPPQEPSADKNNNRRRLRLKSTSRERTDTSNGMALIQYYLISVYYSEQ